MISYHGQVDDIATLTSRLKWWAAADRGGSWVDPWAIWRFPKSCGYLQIIHVICGFFHYKPSIFFNKCLQCSKVLLVDDLTISHRIFDIFNHENLGI